MAFIQTVLPLNLLNRSGEVRSEGFGAHKNLETWILTVLLHQVLLRLMSKLWRLACSRLEREVEFMEPNNHRVSLWDAVIGNKQSLPTRPAANGVI